MTSARLTDADRVFALGLGADDCLTRPFEVQEFAARARAVLRRRSSRAGQLGVYEGARLVADFARVSVRVDGEDIDLTRTEFLLLHELNTHRNRVVSRDQLIDRVWLGDHDVKPRTVDAHIARLRTKLGPAPDQIETVFGLGYRFLDQESAATA